MDKEVIEKIIEILVASRRAGENFGEVAVRNRIAKEVDALYKSFGYVQLDPDQSLPMNPYFFPQVGEFTTLELIHKKEAYEKSQQDMLTPKDGTVWVKIKCPKARFKKVKK